MGRPCTVCRRPDRKEIDRLLFSGEPLTTVAKRYEGQLNRRMLRCHYDNHLVPLLAQAKQVDELAHADSILGELARLKARMWKLLDRSEKQGDGSLTVSAAKEIRSCLELCAKLAGDIQDQTVINVITMPEWVVLQQVVLATLESHPAARLAIADALAHVGVESPAFMPPEGANGYDSLP